MLVMMCIECCCSACYDVLSFAAVLVMMCIKCCCSACYDVCRVLLQCLL